MTLAAEVERWLARGRALERDAPVDPATRTAFLNWLSALAEARLNDPERGLEKALFAAHDAFETGVANVLQLSARYNGVPAHVPETLYGNSTWGLSASARCSAISVPARRGSRLTILRWRCCIWLQMADRASGSVMRAM